MASASSSSSSNWIECVCSSFQIIITLPYFDLFFRPLVPLTLPQDLQENSFLPNHRDWELLLCPLVSGKEPRIRVTMIQRSRGEWKGVLSWLCSAAVAQQGKNRQLPPQPPAPWTSKSSMCFYRCPEGFAPSLYSFALINPRQQDGKEAFRVVLGNCEG